MMSTFYLILTVTIIHVTLTETYTYMSTCSNLPKIPQNVPIREIKKMINSQLELREIMRDGMYKQHFTSYIKQLDDSQGHLSNLRSWQMCDIQRRYRNDIFNKRYSPLELLEEMKIYVDEIKRSNISLCINWKIMPKPTSIESERLRTHMLACNAVYVALMEPYVKFNKSMRCQSRKDVFNDLSTVILYSEIIRYARIAREFIKKHICHLKKIFQ